jgi:hypothetical protein
MNEFYQKLKNDWSFHMMHALWYLVFNKAQQMILKKKPFHKVKTFSLSLEREQQKNEFFTRTSICSRSI